MVAKRIKSDIKLTLLERAEKEIVCVYTEASSCPEIQTKSHLAMAKVALALNQPSTAVQLCLASLRCLQSAEKNADLDRARHVPLSSAPDLRLWLECRSVLANSLVGVDRGWLNCDDVCGEGCEECEACGDIEMGAEFHLTSAMHALSMEPPNLDLLQTHTQVSVTCTSAQDFIILYIYMYMHVYYMYMYMYVYMYMYMYVYTHVYVAVTGRK